MNRPNFIRWGVALVVLLLASPLVAQQEARIATPKDVPFEQIVVREKDETFTIDVRPLVLPGGKTLEAYKDNDKIRFVTEDERTIEVRRKYLISYVKFPQLLLNEANRLTASGDLDGAYEYFDRLLIDYPQYEGLSTSLSGYLYENAKVAFRDQNYAEALGFLEEAKTYRPPVDNLDTAISAATDKLIQRYVEQEDFSAAGNLLQRLSHKRFGEIPAVAKWRNQLNRQAADKRDEARRLMKAGDLNGAFLAAKRMRMYDADVSGGAELSAEIARRFPYVRVGATSPGADAATESMTYAATRDRRLRRRALTEMIGIGADGGQYASPFGTLGRAAGGVEFSFLFRNAAEAFPCSSQIMSLPPSTLRLKLLQQNLQHVELQEGRELQVKLASPHVRPEALARIEIDDLGSSSTPYMAPENDQQRRYVLNDQYAFRTPTQPKAIDMPFFSFSSRALSDLRAGKIDVIDRLFPTSVDDARADGSMIVDHYRIPSIHFLAPNYERPYLQSATFRRGLLYAINRAAILNGRLLGGTEIRGSHVISAPIPAGLEADDPAGYAYDNSIDLRPYEPEMSVTLFRLALMEQEQQAELTDTEAPPLPKRLKIGHPDSEISREAISAISKYLQRVGIEADVVVTDADAMRASDVDVDLLYVEACVQEPLVDVPLLFSLCVPEDQQSPYLRAALRRLNEATNWTEVRERFWTVQRLAFDETTVLPLWQMRDFFVRSADFSGISRQPMSLFQDVERWSVVSLSARREN
ncbi:MAG: ABC transporter substrate-binding protein [Blastopirellula sp. JB062]